MLENTTLPKHTQKTLLIKCVGEWEEERSLFLFLFVLMVLGLCRCEGCFLVIVRRLLIAVASLVERGL